MLVSIDHRGRRRRARLRLIPTSTARDLARAVVSLDDGSTGNNEDADAPAICIDGRPIAAGQTLLEAGLRAGAAVTVGDAPPPDPGPYPGAAVVASGGLAAGDRRSLYRRAVVVGRGLDADLRIDDPTVSCRHAAIEPAAGQWLVRDLESHNGTLVDGRPGGAEPNTETVDDTGGRVPLSSAIQLGATSLRLDLDPPQDRHHISAADTEGRATFDRPPRPPAPADDRPLRAPADPARLAGHTAFSWAMFLAPLVVGLVLAIVFNPLMGALALLSPVVMVASWFENRRREGRATRDNRQTHDRALRQFLADLERRRARVREMLLAAHPDPAEVVRRAVGPSSRLWERRPGNPHALEVRMGVGAVPWELPVDQPSGSAPNPDLVGALAGYASLLDAPVVVDLGQLRVIGIAGPSGAGDAVARSLVLQAAVHHGPADLTVTMLDDEHDSSDGWMSWLPHWSDADRIGPGRHALVVVRCTRPLAPGSRGRRLLDELGGSITVVVLGSSASMLPASCSLVVEITDIHGHARLTSADDSPTADDVRLDGVAIHVAEHTARALARLRDPEYDDDSSLPSSFRLLELLALDPPQPEELLRRWSTDDRALAVLGMGADGPVELDLERDGPHVLVGGTTGAGKSELLRTMVASLAARSSPDNLTFVLVDFKGGSAFDACAALPHTVGVVTDLDGRAGERALRSLQAEVRRRERLLRNAGVTDRLAYRERCSSDQSLTPLPRLVVVVDEFATLARELPEVLAGLVDVAQRGRSLGVHLVLATQRPAGVVNDNIRTNTNARIALRVIDPADSVDLLGEATAAQLENHPGRALLRCGQRPPTALQVAHVSAPAPTETASVEITWLDREPVSPHDGKSTTTEDQAEPTDLEQLVEAARRAWSRNATPHRPWLEPLPVVLSDIELAHYDHRDGGNGQWVLGLMDDPDNQCRRACSWEPSEGPLIIAGMPGSGCSTALRAAALAAAEGSGERHIYVIGALAEHGDLEQCPNVGAVIEHPETERLHSLLQLLDQHAKGAGRAHRILVAIDGFRTFLDAVDRTSGIGGVERWLHLLTDARRHIELVVTTDRLAALPGSLAASTPAKLLLRLGDPYDYAAVGLPPTDARRFPPGRGLDARTGLEVQVRAPQAVVASTTTVADRPDPLSVLPCVVDLRTVTNPGASGGGSLAIGLLDRGRQPALVDPSMGVLVVGPDGSGRSTTLATLAAAATTANRLRIIVTGPPRSRLRDDATTAVHWVDPGDITGRVEELGAVPVLCLVDDAELLDDTCGVERLLESEAVSIVAAAHPDRLRASYGHWTDPLRRARFGIALAPRVHDGELWATTLPADPTSTWPPGRGYLLDHGRADLFQVATP